MSKPVSNPEKILLRLEWTVIRRLDGLLHGNYASLFRGFGVDLADLREYQLHDDVRHIDWNVTARLQTPYVRVYNEDRDVAAWFLLDLSPSVSFGSGQVQERTVAIDFVTVLARLLSRYGNPVGALFYGNLVDTVMPARGGRRHVLHLLSRMLSHSESPSGAPTNLKELLLAGRQIIPRRSLVFVVSDFISTPGWVQPLAQLARRHEIVAVRLFDPLEIALPDLGLLAIQDSETGEQVWVDTHDTGFRKRFSAAAERREHSVRAALGNAGVDTLELSTEDDLVEAIVRFADLRRRRRKISTGSPLPLHLGGKK